MAIPHRKLASEAEAGGLATLYNCTNCDEYSYSSPPAAASPEDSATHTNHAIPYLVSAACVLGVAFLLLTTCTILLRHRCSRRRRVSSTSRHSNEDHEGPVDHPIWHIVTVGLPQSVINSIAAVSYKSCDGAIEGSDCSVCLTKFEDGDGVRLLPKCSHGFHLPCIDTWLRSHKNCPLCRTPVVDDSTPNSGPSESNPVENSENPSEETASADEDDVETWPVQVEGAGIAGIWKSDPVKRASSDVGENVSAVNEDMQPVRRSISLDSSAACEYEVNKPKVVNGEGSSEQQHMVEVEVEVDDKEGHSDSAISRMMKRSLSSLSPFRGSKSHSSSSSSSSSSTLPL